MQIDSALNSAQVMDFSMSDALHVRVLRRMTGYRQRPAQQERLIEALKAEAAVKLHLGCGNKLLSGYVNVDAFSPVADVKADICTLTPFADESTDLIETHHVLEHLSFEQSEAALAVWARKLKPGGHLIISVPDMDACCRLWLRTADERRFGANSISRMVFGSQEHEGMFHKSGYTAACLARQLKRAGFVVQQVLMGYPYRPTPSFLTIAQRGNRSVG
jgi:predicted SAM-dependent methyltransferase